MTLKGPYGRSQAGLDMQNCFDYDSSVSGLARHLRRHPSFRKHGRQIAPYAPVLGVLGIYSSEHVVLLKQIRAGISQLTFGTDPCANSNLSGNCDCCRREIRRNHHNSHAEILQTFDQIPCVSSWRIVKCNQAFHLICDITLSLMPLQSRGTPVTPAVPHPPAMAAAAQFSWLLTQECPLIHDVRSYPLFR